MILLKYHALFVIFKKAAQFEIDVCYIIGGGLCDNIFLSLVECPEGNFGIGCLETCQNCSGGLICNFVTGVCPVPGTCPPGFTGVNCQNCKCF